MPFDRRKTDSADMTRYQKNRPGKNEAQRSRKVSGEKPLLETGTLKKRITGSLNIIRIIDAFSRIRMITEKNIY